MPDVYSTLENFLEDLNYVLLLGLMPLSVLLLVSFNVIFFLEEYNLILF